MQRLKVMCSTNDGFKIADEDLKLRGPGDFFGERQHGLPQMAIADLQIPKVWSFRKKWLILLYLIIKIFIMMI